jgi:hypothetical protein
MAGYSASTCDILTLYPLGVECFTIDAYTPFTTDGYVGLIIEYYSDGSTRKVYK